MQIEYATIVHIWKNRELRYSSLGALSCIKTYILCTYKLQYTKLRKISCKNMFTHFCVFVTNFKILSTMLTLLDKSRQIQFSLKKYNEPVYFFGRLRSTGVTNLWSLYNLIFEYLMFIIRLLWFIAIFKSISFNKTMKRLLQEFVTYITFNVKHKS